MAMPAHQLPGISNSDDSVKALRQTSIVKVDAVRPYSSIAPTRVVDVISNSRDPFVRYHVRGLQVKEDNQS